MNSHSQSTPTSALSSFFSHHRPLVDQALSKYSDFSFSDSRQHLANAIRHSLLAPGKRIRPLLVLASHQLFSDQNDPILPYACAIEMLHTYSLIHDDLPCMDDDDFRRGLPTCHKKFGEDMAVLAGDMLNTYLFELLLTSLRPHYPSDQILDSLTHISHLFGIHGLVGGQALDIRPLPDHADLQHLKTIHTLKTASVIQASVQVPAMLLSQPDSVCSQLGHFAHHLGLLFQITDDILDVTANIDQLGKSPNKDHAQNKLTYVSLLGLEDARAHAEEQAKLAHSCLDQLSPLNTVILSEFIDYVLNRLS